MKPFAANSSSSPDAELLEALSALLPHASSHYIDRLCSSILRALVQRPTSASQSSSDLQVTCNILRAFGAQPSRQSLEQVHALAVARVNALPNSVRHPYQNCLLQNWNTSAAAIYQHIVVLSHAGQPFNDPLPEHSAAASSSTNRAASASSGPSFDPSWLRNRCALLSAVEDGHLTATEMALSVHNMLCDNTISDDALQGLLFDAFAADFDAVADVLAHRAQISQHADAVLQSLTGESSASAPPQRRKQTQKRRARKVGQLSNDFTSEDSFRIQQQPDETAFDIRQQAFPGVELGDQAFIGQSDRIGLPAGSVRELGRGFEQIFVPPPKRSASFNMKLVEVKQALKDHPELLTSMAGVKTLNRLQSSVYPAAFQSDENLLVCAPTGAGKTNVALLTVFREIVAVKTRRQRAFKVVYVAPMKALAAEVTEKFGRRLKDLKLTVREFTGDMSLSRREAIETHVLVTTPEKWDVVTRKSGSELGDAVTLFIVDEVHLLHDERGAVLESIVARTLRLSETAQRRVRLVGLSATLPNYADVGEFMRVNPEKGLFHFDGSHRPVPLSQTFIGISEGATSNAMEARRKREDKVHERAWDKVEDSLQRGHQAMVFVHSRKGTANAAREMLRRAAQDGVEDIFLGQQKDTEDAISEDGGTSSVLPSWAARAIAKSRTAEIRELCSRGVGIHNAGLPRPDRKLVEKLFAEGVIRLLCCTATLAWGVNLPARTVVIMGTELYDAEKGGFVQLGMLDVMQIFGRAGRPQFDTEGEATIITMHKHLNKYLRMFTSSVPIESTLGASATRLSDHLNAEIVSGTVSSIGDGVKWLSYTFLSVRMPKNPLVYGINRDEVAADSGLHSRRATLLEQAAKALDDARMCRYDPRTGSLAPTDLGRVSSHYYVSRETVTLWNELFSNIRLDPAVTDQDWEDMYSIVIHAISCCTEFEQMRSREEELDELDKLSRESCPIPLKTNPDMREGKVAVLIQAYISGTYVRMSDLSYVVQSATRLLRAFFEIALGRGVPGLAMAALELARSSESRIWPFQHPLWQFTYLAGRDKSYCIQTETVDAIEKYEGRNSINDLRTMSTDELSKVIRAPRMVPTVQKVLRMVPLLDIIEAAVRPLSRTLLRFEVKLFPSFRWIDKLHGNVESWWIWVEDVEENRIYQSQKILLNKTQVRELNSEGRSFSRKHSKTIDISFTVAVFDPPSSHYWIRIESDRWHTGRASSSLTSVEPKLLPQQQTLKTTLLDLRPVPLNGSLTASEVTVFERRMSHFNPIQTQAFHIARHTNRNMLLCGPQGCGIWALGRLGMLRAFEQVNKAIVYLNPHKGKLLAEHKAFSELVEYSGTQSRILSPKDSPLAFGDVRDWRILFATPKVWCHLTDACDSESLMQSVSLFIFDDIHDLSSPSHAGIETVMVRLKSVFFSTRSSSNTELASELPRVIALGGRIQNGIDVAQWLHVSKEAAFCFSREQREVPCESHVIGVAGDRYASRMYSMNKPVFSMVQRHSPNKPVLIFVSSKRQALNTTRDLLRHATIEGKPKMFVGKSTKTPNEAIRRKLRNLQDKVLRFSAQSGVTLFHDNLSQTDQDIVQDMFQFGNANVLVCTFDMARRLRGNIQAHQVIVKGTEMYIHEKGRYEDLPVSELLQLVGRAGRPGTDMICYAVLFVHEPKKTLLRKFVNEPLPAESALVGDQLKQTLLKEIESKRVSSISGLLDWMSMTFLYRRCVSNPGYYKAIGDERLQYSDSQMVERPSSMQICQSLVERALAELIEDGSIKYEEGRGNLSFAASSMKGERGSTEERLPSNNKGQSGDPNEMLS